MLNRRDFLKTTAAAAALAAARPALALHSGPPPLTRIGLGLFTIPWLLEQDFEGAMRKLAEIGYREVEFFGPYPFSAPAAHASWNAVTAFIGFSGSGYFGKEVHEVRAILDRYGLSSPSMHTDLVTLQTRMPELAEAAHVLGQRYAIIPALGAQPSLDAYRRAADTFNEIGASAAQHGIRFAYHNHGYGLQPLEGKIPFDLLLEATDPALVDFQMDIYWTTAGGADPVAYLDAWPGRFRLMHVKDMAEHVRFSGDGSDPQQWFALFPYLTDAGSGVLDLKAILSHAQASGVQHFYVERDRAPDASAALHNSYRYLSTLALEPVVLPTKPVPASSASMFVHAVYFWLREDLQAAERETFVAELHHLIALPSVRHGYVGVPAATDRPIIDRSYSYALVVVFDDQAGHDAYQVHPVHDRFRETCGSFWTRVQIYDSVGPEHR
jgi:sugar phosphate isomerase/epimerase